MSRTQLQVFKAHLLLRARIQQICGNLLWTAGHRYTLVCRKSEGLEENYCSPEKGLEKIMNK